jgi:dienelactone hydrolase
MTRHLGFLCVLCVSVVNRVSAEPLPNTKPLEVKGDLAAIMVEGIGKYLDRELAASVEKRKQHWKIDTSSPEAYAKSVAPNRERLKKILGVVDERVKFTDIEYVGGPNTPSLVAETDLYKVHAIRWPVLPGVDGEGLLLEPKGKVVAQVVAIPDADWTPEQLVGLAPGVPKESQFARRLAENGCRVVVPVLINRKDDYSGSAKFNKWTNQPHREFIYRMAYEMGRHIIGYEVQKVLALVDWFTREKGHTPVGILGTGEGALLALLSASCDPRTNVLLAEGLNAFDLAPIYRNVWSMRSEFGEDLFYLLPGTGRNTALTFSDELGPVHPKARNGRGGAAPISPEEEMQKLRIGFKALDKKHDELQVGGVSMVRIDRALAKYSMETHVYDFLRMVNEELVKRPLPKTEPPKDHRKSFDPEPCHKRQFDQIVAHVQKLWRDSEPIRWARFAKCDFSSPEKYEASIEPIRKFFDEEVIGKLPAPTLPMNPKSREIYDTPKWKGYEVTLDLYPDVFAEGILLLPKGMKDGEKRPVVVCQHGLEGKPTDVCNPKELTKYYNSFGAQLADRGYIVFAPQNPYIGKDLFRVLQRKANPLKLSLFSFIVRQHERILDWLETLPNVDKDRMAFYGLSYGGKTAMRVPAILKKYCLSICSGDFNEWIGKNVSVSLDKSYMWTIEYEMYEFDLGHTFNYAEMAYLIAPRPFMVERGHDDGVGTDEMVAYEYAKVRYMYENRLKLPDRQELEFFVGGHVINGKGTFAFLDRHLKWTPR